MFLFNYEHNKKTVPLLLNENSIKKYILSKPRSALKTHWFKSRRTNNVIHSIL